MNLIYVKCGQREANSDICPAQFSNPACYDTAIKNTAIIYPQDNVRGAELLNLASGHH